MADPRVIRRVRAEGAEAAPTGSRVLSRCAHCHRVLMTEAGGVVKLAVRSRVLAFKGGIGEMNCPHCGEATPLPEVRFVVMGPARS